MIRHSRCYFCCNIWLATMSFVSCISSGGLGLMQHNCCSTVAHCLICRSFVCLYCICVAPHWPNHGMVSCGMLRWSDGALSIVNGFCSVHKLICLPCFMLAAAAMLLLSLSLTIYICLLPALTRSCCSKCMCLLSPEYAGCCRRKSGSSISIGNSRSK